MNLVLYGMARSGHHLTRQILWHHFGKPSTFWREGSRSRVPWEREWVGQGVDPECPITFQHRYPAEQPGQKVIYLLRDGRAVMVSLFQYLRAYHDDQYRRTTGSWRP